jgi:precorrin-6Y C5,15-methyltransferase (decarboxylating)
MGKIYVIGTGPGSIDYLTPAARKAVEKADVIVGGKNALSLFSFNKPNKFIDKELRSVLEYISDNREKNIAVLTSGDPGFYSILGLLTKNFPREDIEVIPGISSVQLCFAKLKDSWHDARFISLHGRNIENLLTIHGEKIVILTDEASKPEKIAQYLLDRGIKGRAWVCDSLCQSSERIIESDLRGISSKKFSGNAIMVVKPSIERKWRHRTPGIPDKLFEKGGSPMTKEEVRVITISKARINRDSVVYDIGSGTGSIAIEAAIQADMGKVYSIEKNPERCKIIMKNILAFGLPNIEVVQGEAPEVIESLSPADRIIVGGSGGKIREIIEASITKLKRDGVIVINAFKEETIKESTKTLKDLNLNYNITTVSIERIRGGSVAKLNPISIIDARRQ